MYIFFLLLLYISEAPLWAQHVDQDEIMAVEAISKIRFLYNHLFESEFIQHDGKYKVIGVRFYSKNAGQAYLQPGDSYIWEFFLSKETSFYTYDVHKRFILTLRANPQLSAIGHYKQTFGVATVDTLDAKWFHPIGKQVEKTQRTGWSKDCLRSSFEAVLWWFNSKIAARELPIQKRD